MKIYSLVPECPHYKWVMEGEKQGIRVCGPGTFGKEQSWGCKNTNCKLHGDYEGE
jgi:hypothetical protein